MTRSDPRPSIAAASAPPEPSPYDTPELYDRFLDGLDFDLPYWLEVARGGGGPLLEIACGTGRVMTRLAAAGVDVDGIDLSEPMVARLRAKLAAQGARGEAWVADMRDFELPRRYARAICALNGFAHCETVDEQLATLRCVHRHLAPGGALVIHMSYPSPSYWASPDGEPVLETEVPLPDGSRLQMWDTRSKDPAAQRQRSEMEMRQLDAGGRVIASHRSFATQRWVYRYEFELLFRLAGYQRCQVFGDFAGEPFARAEQQMLAWGWKAP